MGERHQPLPRLVDGKLIPPGEGGHASEAIAVGSPSWFGWLADEGNSSFTLPTGAGAITVRRERQRRGTYWYAYARRGGKVRKTYVGRSVDLSLDRLQRSVAHLARVGAEQAIAAPPGTRLRLLGPPRFSRDGRSVALGAAKAVALLGYLAVADAPPTREQLQTLFWPESDAARGNLRNTLWSIRKRLGPAVRDVGDRLALDDAVWVDVREFARLTPRAGGTTPDLATLQAAADLAAGPLMDGIVIQGAAEFELWLTMSRARLDDAVARVVGALVAAHRDAGRWPEVLEIAGRAVARDPLCEPMHRAVMEAYARLGNRAAALRQYDTLCDILARELGVAPLPEADVLRAAIFDGTLTPVVSASAPSSPLPSRSRAPAPFVGREDELAALDAELTRAAAGEVRVTLLVGELGIGKSRLWQTWAAGRGQGASWLATRCLEATQSLPFAPLIGLLTQERNACRLLRPATLPPVWLNELVRLAPELAVGSATTTAGFHGLRFPPDEERRRVFEALTQGVVALAPRAAPAVLFVDDVHWADRATLDWLGYLVERWRGRPLLLALALRPEDQSSALATLVAGWLREQAARRIPLAPLSRAEAAALIAALTGQTDRVGRYYEQSGGNPFFLTELVRAAPGTLPPVLSELLQARLERLPEGARQVLQAAAVLEPDLDAVTLQRTSGRTEDETLDAVDLLIRASILGEGDGGYAFLHPFLATVVREALGSARRAVLHRRAAAALEASQAASPVASGALPSPLAGRLATHHVKAGDAARAVPYADRAAAHALQIAAPTEAEDWARQALALEPTPQRRLTLAHALFRQGRLADARALYEEALDGFEEQGDRRAAAWASLGIATTQVILGRLADAEREKARAVSFLEGAPTPEARGLVELLTVVTRWRMPQLDLAEESRLFDAARFATSQGFAELAIQGLFTLGTIRAERGDLAGAVSAFRVSLDHAQSVGNVMPEVLSRNGLAYHSLLMGDLATARAEIESALALAEEQVLEYPRQWLSSTRGEVALAEGHLDEAAAWFKRGLTETTGSVNGYHVAGLQANLGLVARARGDLDEALRWIESAARATAAIPTSHEHAKVSLLLAEVHADRGDTAAAADALVHVEACLAGRTFAGLDDQAARLRRRLVSERMAS